MSLKKIKLYSLITVYVLLSCSNQNQKTSKMKIIYFYDALCGWCYGFSPAISKLQAEYKTKIEFEVVSGGMITGERIGAIGVVAPYIKTAYKDVENYTGIKFGKSFLDKVLEKGNAIFTSIPAAKAMVVFREFKPENQIDYASKLQKGIYYEGKLPEEINWYAEYAAEFGINKEEFLLKFNLPQTISRAEKDFNRCKEFGVEGFPTVVAEKNGKFYAIARGYIHYDELKLRTDSLLNIE